MAFLRLAIGNTDAKRALASLVWFADRVFVSISISIAGHHTIAAATVATLVVAIVLGASKGKDRKDCDDDGARVHDGMIVR